jgi:serine/threonine-protein kinase
MSRCQGLSPGTIFARDFRVVRKLAEGGMGEVYEVEQLSTRKARALKVMQFALLGDERQRERFLQEAHIASGIESDHVIEVVSAGVDEDSGAPWLALELLRGVTLSERLTRGPLPLDDAREVFRQLRHALGQAHAMGLVHRDLKPENVFIATARRSGVPFTVKLLDFGISKWVQEHCVPAINSQVIGSPFWMAPEQLEAGARIVPATDVWALGLMAFAVLTGRFYWRSVQGPEASVGSAFVEVLTLPLDRASARAREFGCDVTLPEGFDAWFARSVARAPEERFADAERCLAALDGVLAPNAHPPTVTRDSLTTPITLSSTVSFGDIGRVSSPEVAPIALASSSPASERAVEHYGSTMLAISSASPSRSSSPTAASRPRARPSPPQATAALLPSLAPDRGDLDAILARFQGLRASGMTDRAWCAAHALVTIAPDVVPLDVRAFHDRYASPLRRAPEASLDEADWVDHLLGDATATELALDRLLSALTPMLHEAIARSPTDMGLTERERVDPRVTSTTLLRVAMPLHQAMLAAASTLDVAAMPTVYHRAAQEDLFRCMPTEPWATVVGAGVHRRLDPGYVAFLAARHIAYYRPELYVRALFPTPAALARLLDTLRMTLRASASSDVAGDETLIAVSAALRARFADDPTSRRALAALLEACAGTRLDAWFKLGDRAAARAGLLLGGDLGAALRGIEDSPGVPVLAEPSALRDDLVRFTVSDAHARLRESLGIAVA